MRALGLEQRVFARPLGGRPLGHLSSRKAGHPPTQWAFPEAMPARNGRPLRKSSRAAAADRNKHYRESEKTRARDLF